MKEIGKEELGDKIKYQKEIPSFQIWKGKTGLSITGSEDFIRELLLAFPGVLKSIAEAPVEEEKEVLKEEIKKPVVEDKGKEKEPEEKKEVKEEKPVKIQKKEMILKKEKKPIQKPEEKMGKPIIKKEEEYRITQAPKITTEKPKKSEEERLKILQKAIDEGVNFGPYKDLLMDKNISLKDKLFIVLDTMEKKYDIWLRPAEIYKVTEKMKIEGLNRNSISATLAQCGDLVEKYQDPGKERGGLFRLTKLGVGRVTNLLLKSKARK